MDRDDLVTKGAADSVALNGIDGATGRYLIRGLTESRLSKLAQGESLEEPHLAELVDRFAEKDVRTLGVKAGVDPDRLDQAGWGVIFALGDARENLGRKEALKPLLDLRKEQAGQLYREFDGADAVRPGESKLRFLARHKMGPSPAEPERVPYYLLIVASPESISYRFQYQLDVQYAVGRIHFETLEEYARYARSVAAADKGEITRPRQAMFFGVENFGDRATSMSAQQLIRPLSHAVAEAPKQSPWDIETRIKEGTRKSDLAEVLSREDGPALLFTASHGVGFPKEDKRQIPHQGALLCEDWPGPREWNDKPIPEEHYFSADDIAEDCRAAGLVTFHFACYGAGTPLVDDFAHTGSRERLELAKRPFIARLPQKLLGHQKGGVLAAIGHVERAWSYSFKWPQAGPQISVFESALRRMMTGSPVGSAMEYFSDRYAELATELNFRLEDIKFGGQPNDSELARLWTASNDARSYAIVGDPAVRLAVG